MVSKHKNWTSHEWILVLFTDESFQSEQRFLAPIDMEDGTRFHSPLTLGKRDHLSDLGMIVCGDVMLNERKELHVFDSGSLTGDCYRDEIRPHVHLFRCAIDPDFTRVTYPHRTSAAEELLKSEDICRMTSVLF
ncbi:transposable element Tcb2 transposase [Trichonephila clavipes]|nr:transposable element Tcb2 transposase [Trichonephila clavipes]